MALAKKCDICGALYEYEIYKEKGMYNPNEISLIHVTMDNDYYPGEVMDCCPDCMRSIQDLIESLKKKGERNEGTSNVDD